MNDAELGSLAEAAGLQGRWVDAAGRAQTVAPETLRRLLEALDVPPDLRAGLAHLSALRATAPLASAEAGRPVILPAALPAGPARLILEDGETQEVVLHRGRAGPRAPPIGRPGYHRLETRAGATTLAVAPRRAFTPWDAAGRPLWGVGVQAYGVTDPGAPGFGDFGAVGRFGVSAADAGAALLAISPVHALFAADPARFSPYAPSSRLFLNGLMADPRVVFPDAAAPPAAAGGDLIDWKAEWPARLDWLRTLHRRFRSDDSRRDDFQAFRREGGEDLEGHAVFEALHGRFFREHGAHGWRQWPAQYRDRGSPAVAAFAREAAAEVEFHVFLQWLARRSLGAAQDAMRRAGMAIGLVADLAVGMDAGGSHAWSRPADLIAGANVGAPPDPLGPNGQDWGISAFSPAALRASGYAPFIATLRSSLASAGGVRIDHAMGLRRLWLAPHGAAPTEGAYLDYPFDDLIRLVTLESHRARAIVIAEDLGTVPAGFRQKLKSRGLMGMQVLWFERSEAGGFRAPGRWSGAAAALTTTHDLPTVAGWWSERDIDWAWRLGRRSPYATEHAARAARAAERRRLWNACKRAGVAEGAQPPANAPDPAVDAAIGLVARTPAELAIVAAEDLAGLREQPNIPGTTDEHPNWRRRLPTTNAMWSDPALQRRIGLLEPRRARP